MQTQDKKTIWGIILCVLLLLMIYSIALVGPSVFVTQPTLVESSQNNGKLATLSSEKGLIDKNIIGSVTQEIAFKEPATKTGQLPISNTSKPTNSNVSGGVINPDFFQDDSVESDVVKVNALIEEQLVVPPMPTSKASNNIISDVEEVRKYKNIDTEAINNEKAAELQNSQGRNLELELAALRNKNTENLTFRFGELVLSDKAITLVKSIAKIMTANKGIAMEIRNYTDSYGDDNFNLNLSKQRSEVIYNAFLKEGVSESQLSHEGLGEASPIVSNATLAGRRKNRRTELSFSKVN